MNDDEKPNKSEAASKDEGKDKGPKDLNELLASWDDSGKSESKKDGSEKKGNDDAILSEIADLRLQIDLPKYVDAVRGDTGVSEKYATGLISEAIRTDEKFAKLWDSRHSNKEAFNSALKMLNKEAQAEVSNLTKKSRPDDELAAAVHSAREGTGSGSKLDSVDFGSLSDSELAIKKAEVFRLAKSGELRS